MNKDKILKNGFDMLYLSACALHSIVPDAEKVYDMDLKEIYLLSSRHFMQAITFIAIESFISQNPEFREKIPNDLFNEWKLVKSKAVRSDILFDVERKKLTAFLEENKIWYAYIKGIVIQRYYNRSEMRQMCDNDLFFDASRRKEVYDYMVNSGFEVIYYEKGCPDSYKKKPSVLFEMHHSLYRELAEEKVFNNYYANAKEMLLKDEDNDYGYHFNDEDFYIHFTTHDYKHFINAGSGIRSLMDIFVYINDKGDSLNFEYINEELSKLGIIDFENEMRTLAMKLFSKETISKFNFISVLTEEELELFLFCVTSGTYGNKISYIKNRVKRGTENRKNGVFKYILRRFFPEMSFFKMKYPKIYKYKILIPFLAIYRIFSRSIVNFRELKFEFKVIFKKK